MAFYSQEFKDQTVRKLMPPNLKSVADVSRETGIPTPTLYAWKSMFETMDAAPVSPRELSAAKKKTKQLEKELRRKEKALAETAALLTLSKKAHAIWAVRGSGVNEDD